MEPEAMDVAYLVCTDAVPAGILLGKRMKEGTVEIILDYSTPAYRDCSVGAYLYSKLPERGIHKLVYAGTGEKHEPYLRKMGFVLKGEVYEKKL